MKIETLLEAIDLSKTLNFTKTAANRYITQPALSRHIAGLEDELGILIFKRSKHSVELTDDGAVLIEHMRAIVAEYEKLLDAADLFNEGFNRRLHVGYIVTASRPFIAHAASLFEKRYPNVFVDYDPLPPAGVNAGLSDGSLDLAFTASTFIELGDSLVGKDIYDDEYCLAVGRESTLAGRSCVRVEDLTEMEIVFPEEQFAAREYAMYQDVFSRIPHTVSKKKSRQIEDFAVLLANGNTAAPMLSHAKYYGERSFVLIPFADNPFPKAHVIAVYDKEKRSDMLDAFIECAREGYELAMETGR